VSSSSNWHLYVIVDQAALGARESVGVAAAAIRGGADVIQLRAKSGPLGPLYEAARRVAPLARSAGVALIINDHADVARAAGADGVHLGQEDLPIAAAREILGPGRLIGKSTHSFEQALAADAEGADYIGFGPIFPTPTKPAYGSIGLNGIRGVSARARIPVVCIGGIDPGNVGQVMQAGALCVAAVRAVCAAEDPEAATRELKRALTQFLSTRSASYL
jgi:thiamine-phosphate pyrophosphorylase